MNFLADVFNLLNAQRAVVLDERYNVAEFDDAGYVCGSKPGTDDEKRCNSSSKRPLFRTAPRQLRLGLRVSF